MTSKALAAVLGMASVTEAFWRMECRGTTGYARIDPIIDFGNIASHSHVAHGSSGFSFTSNYEDLRNGDCTSCAVKQDKSAYWTPNLYFLDDETQTFTPVNQVGGMLAYYLVRGENVTAFPAGFQMVAGNNLRRDYTVGDPYVPDPPQSNWAALKQTSQTDLSQRALGFNCLNYQAPAEPSLFRHYMPNKTFTDAQCTDGLRFELMFPSCWNGELDSPDHQSHVAYPDLVGDGTCPDTHPQRLVTLFYETIWDTHNTQFLGKSGSFVMSNGDRTGFGYHGDFIAGWDPAFLQDAVDTCTNESGELTDCELFTSNGPLLTQEEQGQCQFTMPEALAGENVLAVLTGLPGGIQIQDGPQSATLPAADVATSLVGGILGGSSATATPSSTSSPAASSADSQSGGAFIQSPAPASPVAPASGSVTNTPSATTPIVPTTTPAPQATSELGVSYEAVSTQYLTSTDLVEEIVWMQPVVYVTEDVTTTVTAKMARDHVRRHHRHGRSEH